MIKQILASIMVVKHIKINEENRKQLERLINSGQKDWIAISILCLVLAVAVIGIIWSL